MNYLLCPVGNADTFFQNLGKVKLPGNWKLISDSTDRAAPEKFNGTLDSFYTRTQEADPLSFIAFAHEDVVVDAKFLDEFVAKALKIASSNNNAVLFGVAGAVLQHILGRGRVSKVYSCLMDKDQYVDNVPEEGCEVETLDECFFGCFARDLNRIRFDKCLSGKHLYATKLCLKLAMYGCTSHVVRAHWLHHNSSQGREVLDPGYYMDMGIAYDKYGEFVTTSCSIEKRRANSEVVKIRSLDIGPTPFKTAEDCLNARNT